MLKIIKSITHLMQFRFDFLVKESPEEYPTEVCPPTSFRTSASRRPS